MFRREQILGGDVRHVVRDCGAHLFIQNGCQGKKRFAHQFLSSPAGYRYEMCGKVK
jgi:hypothetical protein